MKTDYAMVIRTFSCYSHIFGTTTDFIRLYNPNRKYFDIHDVKKDIYDSCLPGDMVEYTEEPMPKIVRNLDYEKRLANFNARYKELQKQR